jgi:hypothetical protein
MDTRTGKTYGPVDPELRRLLQDREARKDLVEVDDSVITSKQRKDMQVSKHDTKSVLGRRFTSARKLRKAAARSAKGGAL